ncbi:MAG: DUF885 domain-containing protein [Flavobacteriales bacterium]|nr:DUF885 domain-containing protein [Flavobacteriales bacterium]
MRTYQYLTAIFVALHLFACQNKSSETQSTEKVNTDSVSAFRSMLEQYNEDRLRLFPIDATYAGDNRYNDQLPNYSSLAFQKEIKGFYQKYLGELDGYDPATMDDNDKVSYDVLKWECETGLADMTFPSYEMPVNQFSSMHLVIGQLAAGESAQPFKTAKDYENWLSRLDAYVVWCDTTIQRMKEGMASGRVLPRILAEKTVPQMAALDHGPVEDHLFYMPVKLFPEGMGEEDKARLKEAYTKMIGEKIIPAYKRFHDFIKNSYVPACRESSGIDGVPGGRAYYDTQIKKYTTTDMTADEVFQLGMGEVDRLKAEMEKVKESVGFDGDLKAFFDHVRNKKELMPFTQPQQVIDHFNEIHSRMKVNLMKLFNNTPKAGFEVRRTEAFREASASAEYTSGSKDGSRPGIFYVPIPDVHKYNIFADEDLFLHEAIPGHHYQVSLAQENKSLPTFRQTLWYSSYVEGWALYCESLGKELGLYTDPYQYFGMLSAEMHRAIRLVVDVGMHVKGWSREQAIQFSMENEAEPEASIVAEIERYMSWPGQALSYKIGQLKIRELRAMAEERLGASFDVRAFHDHVLESGSVPLAVLEKRIKSWVEEELRVKN